MSIISIYALSSVLIVSLVSMIGLFTLSIATRHLMRLLLVMVAFAAGSLFGDVFFHLLPEVIEEYGFDITISYSIIAGIIVFFILEKFVHWHHCHIGSHKGHMHSLAVTNLVGDALHNFLDGIIIAASYMISIPVGVATTIAVMFHEIPQEIGDFGVLIHSGLTKWRALIFNFLSALTALGGAVLALSVQGLQEHAEKFFVPFTIGAFIYIAGSDLIPELKREDSAKKSLAQLLAFGVGIFVMWLLLFLD